MNERLSPSQPASGPPGSTSCPRSPAARWAANPAARRSSATRQACAGQTVRAWRQPRAVPAPLHEPRSPQPARAPPPTAPRRLTGGFQAAAELPTGTPCRGDRRNTASGCRRSCGRSAGCRCRPAPTRSSCPSIARSCAGSCSGEPGSAASRTRSSSPPSAHPREFGEAVGEGVGNAEVHGYKSTFFLGSTVFK